MRGVAAAWRCPDVGRLFLLNLSAYSSYVLVVGLWGGPYLTHVYGYDLAEHGTLLFVAALTQVLGMLVWGASGHLVRSYKPLVNMGSGSNRCAAFGCRTGGNPAAGRAMRVVYSLWHMICLHARVGCKVGRGITLLNMATVGAASCRSPSMAS